MILDYAREKCKPHLEDLAKNAPVLGQQFNTKKEERTACGLSAPLYFELLICSGRNLTRAALSHSASFAVRPSPLLEIRPDINALTIS